ncbi:uncharacterized protein LOC123545094 [Mercenaria mercenaria]|uniref:uncharacterized protein LOC123545094 n=1 Tax=Mercenaria mercenaria TaxID=6596 RepID=UPI00234EDA68|nr:uncharacterized protein LOC123545094 [Mercenaria mercenaria]
MRPARNIRVYVRNKSRYNPETGERNFLFVDINDFAGTTIGDVKENVRRQCRGAVRIDELFLDNQSLADDRSVAHYNLEDECILETTSNPFWVTCLYIKASEVKQEMEGNPNDKQVQSWTQKSLPKKYTLIGLLLNAKNEYGRQPPHFATLDEFAVYLERLDKKGATMHPEYTQKDLRAFEREYRQEFVGRYDDPIAAFIDHHAVRLGHALPDEIEQRPLDRPNIMPRHVEHRDNNVVARPRGGGRKKQEKYCDDCEEALAEVYCAECQGGLAMCRRCSNLLHAGASRRRHNLQDIEQAPTNTGKPYVPRAFLAPFSIVLAMYSALTSESRLSLTEDEIKRRAQPLTDTDLQDKQAGKYVGGFDCMENMLMNKGLVKKEAARNPTYSLSASGQVLGQRLFIFYTQFYRFMESCRLPKVQNTARNGVINNRKLCLIIDDNERDKQRLLRYAAEKNIDAQVRLLPAGDYIWILTPPMVNPQASYTDKDYGNELVLPFVVERKSWEDFENTTNSARFKRQINNMLGSGLTNCFYLMEGGTSGLRNNPTQHHQQYLKGLLEKLMTENGFYVNYTSSWMKSAQWLFWFTGFLIDGCRTGSFEDECISYQEYMSRAARQRGNTVVNPVFRNVNRTTHTWKAQLFVDHIIRDSQRERAMITTVREDLGAANRNSKHLLVIQDLEQYNKRRQSALNKCCEAVHANPDQARDIVQEKIGPVVHNMLHYDIASYWQLYMQVMTGVYVVRTETSQDTEKIHRIFTSTPVAVTTPEEYRAPVPKSTHRRSTNPKKSSKTATITSAVGQGHVTNEPPQFDHGLLPRVRHLSGPHVSNQDNDFDNLNTPHVHRRADIHSIYSQVNITSPFHRNEESKEEEHSTAGHVIKRGRRLSNSDLGGQTVQPSPEKPVIQPFSGQGYCLGTRSAEKHESPKHTQDKSINAQDKSIKAVQNTRISSPAGLGRAEPRLVGGMWNSTNNPQGGRRKSSSDDDEPEGDMHDIDQSLHHTDFVNSQNEEDIIGEILAKSAAEASTVSNEDEMLKLAVEISKQNSRNKTNAGNELTDDEQLKLALEMSKTSHKPPIEKEEVSSIPGKASLDLHEKSSVVNLSEEEQLNHVLQISKVETGQLQKKIDIPASNKIEVDIEKNDDDKMFKLALEMSRKEGNRLHRNKENEMPSDVDKEDVILIPGTEEDQVKLALEMSRKETLKNNINDPQIDRPDKVNRIPCKRKNDESEKCADRKFRVDIHENLSEEEQLKLAMELSISQIAEENENSNMKASVRSRIYESFGKSLHFRKEVEESNKGISPFKKTKLESDNEPVRSIEREGRGIHGNCGISVYDENKNLKVAIERSKVEHSPVKKVKVGKMFLDEDEMINIAIERSKVEHSPLKKSVANPSEECVGDNTDNVEVIEINSQNSQEGDDYENCSGDLISSVDASLQKDISDNSSKLEESARTYHIDINDPTHRCTTAGTCIELGTPLSKAKTGLSPKIDISHYCAGDNNTTEDEGDMEDSDYIPPSPGRTSFSGNGSLSQSFFSKTPENLSQKNITLCKPARNLYDEALPDGQSKYKVSKTDASCLQNDLTVYGNCARKMENETDDLESSYEKLKESVGKNKKFNIKASLFYDSSDSESGSEDDIFRDLDAADDDGDGDDGCGDNENLSKKNFHNEFEENADTENKFEKRKKDDALFDSGESKLGKNMKEVKNNVKFNETAYRENHVDSKKDKTMDQFSVTSGRVEPENDKEMFEADQNPEDDYLDFDDDNDIDYQPDSQDMKMDSESESGDNDCSDLEENSQERNDLDLLPLIRRPRKIRYRQLKEESESLYEQKRKEKELNELNSEILVKTEVGSDQEGSELTADEIFARQVQEELDREAKQQEEEQALIDDAYIARQLHETLNKEPPPSHPGEQMDNQQKLKNQMNNSERTKEADVTQACRGQNQETSSSFIPDKATNVDTEFATSSGNPEALVRELQRRELEKIERWRKMLVEDEKLARGMQEMQDYKTEEEIGGERKIESNVSRQVEPSFKQMVAQHKASKEKAIAQLQEYRDLQMRRFQEAHGGPLNSITSRQSDNSRNFDNNDVIIVDEPQDFAVPRTNRTPYRDTRPDVNPQETRTMLNRDNHNIVTESQSAIYNPNINHSFYNDHMNQPSQSKPSVGNQINQSQAFSGDHMTQSSQSQSVVIKHSNVTCGNCGEKGHNRTFPKCSKYHTAEESARREAKLEKQRLQKEEKKKQEVETIHMLSEHRRVLEEMTSQIQQEMGTIQNRLQQRASELESQVSTRVRKIENAHKKKKR